MTTTPVIVPRRSRVVSVSGGYDLLDCGHERKRLAEQSTRPGRTCICFACIRENTPKPRPKWGAPHARRRPAYKLFGIMRKCVATLRKRKGLAG